MSGKFKVHKRLTRTTSTLHGDQYAFLIISRSFPLKMGNVSVEICRENQNTLFVFNNFFFSFVRGSVEKYCTAGQDTNDNMAHAHFMLDP
jgi:hypothetical protein